MVNLVGSAIVAEIAVSCHIYELNFFGGIAESNDVERSKMLGKGEYGANALGVERFYDAGSEAEGSRSEGDCLELEAVVAEAVCGECRVEALHEVGYGALLECRPIPFGEIAGPLGIRKYVGTLLGIAHYAVAERLEVAAGGAVAGELYEAVECFASNGLLTEATYAAVSDKELAEFIEFFHVSFHIFHSVRGAAALPCVW